MNFDILAAGLVEPALGGCLQVCGEPVQGLAVGLDGARGLAARPQIQLERGWEIV
jgi:hypothetical protein